MTKGEEFCIFSLIANYGGFNQLFNCLLIVVLGAIWGSFADSLSDLVIYSLLCLSIQCLCFHI